MIDPYVNTQKALVQQQHSHIFIALLYMPNTETSPTVVQYNLSDTHKQIITTGVLLQWLRLCTTAVATFGENNMETTGV